MIRDGDFTLLCPKDEQVFAYTRDTAHGHLLVVCNFVGEDVGFDWPEQFADAEKLIGHYAGREQTLRPYEAAMFYYED